MQKKGTRTQKAQILICLLSPIDRGAARLAVVERPDRRPETIGFILANSIVFEEQSGAHVKISGQFLDMVTVEFAPASQQV
jgi:hypothetical protein